MSFQINILNSQTQTDGSFYISGVFWLTAPVNFIISNNSFISRVLNITLSDLAALRAGTLVEQSFTSGLFPSGTSLASVQTNLQALFTSSQNSLNNINPPLAGLIGSTYNGVSWASSAANAPTIPVTNYNLPITLDIKSATAYGFLPNIISNRSSGYISTAAASGVAIRATVYTPQGANSQRSIKSTNINDTLAGTGAQKITINYLNTSFQLKQDIINLNGTTAVNTNATDIAFIENMVVSQVGTQGGGNLGTIQILTGLAGAGSIWGSIAISDNTTFWAHHYVPTGFTCYLLNISGGATATAGRVTINRSGNPLSVNLPQLGVGGTYPHLAAGNEDHMFVVPIGILGPDFIWLVETPNAATASTAFGTFEYLQW